MQDEPALALRGISKGFPGVQALSGVDLAVNRGEVMGLVGENGAGKSTLMKILAGVHRPDRGELSLFGKPVRVTGPRHARDLGVAVIYQELNLAEEVSVAENVFASALPARLGFVDFAELHVKTQAILETLHIDIDPRTKVRRLSVARKQMVEIARALAFEARIIVMDEPTSSLTEREVEVLLELVKKLRERGVAILYTSHRLDEVFEVANRITVLRDGRLVGVRLPAESSATEIVSMMVGREVSDLYGEPGAVTPGDEVLAVRGVCTAGRLQDVSFVARAGEIIGFAGLIGAGRTEVARAIFGVDGKAKGAVALRGRPVEIASPREAIEAGVGYLPEERKLQSLFLGLSVRSNATVTSLGRISRRGLVDGARERALAQDLVRQFGVKTPTLEQEIRHLSGGNQQKVVIARWLAVSPKVLFLDEPTRGVDVGAKAEIYALMREMAGRGMAIVMISSELPEVLGMSDRVIVLRGGRVAGELPRAQATEEAVMHLATGVSSGAGVAA